MLAINSDHKWGVSGKGTGVARLPPPTRSLPSSPPRIDRVEQTSLSAMLGEYHQDQMRGEPLMTSSLPSYPPPNFRAIATGESMEMTTDLLDLTKPMPWDRLKRGASTMSLDSLNENYMESVPGEMAVLDDQDKTPVATCTCGKTTNFECWVHRVPFGGARELTDEISQTCLQLVRELRSEPSGCDGVVPDLCNGNKPLDFGESDLHTKRSPPTNHIRASVDTPCSWSRERPLLGDQLGAEFDTPSSKSSGSLASAPSVHRSELSSSPDSYDLLYKSFEVAVEMDRLQLERGQSEGSSVGSSLESLNRTSPKLQKVLVHKRRSSPDGSGESPADLASCDSITGSNRNLILSPGLPCKLQPVTVDKYQVNEVTPLEDLRPLEDASQKVTFASLAKKKKKPEVATPQAVPSEATHWTELVTSATPKEAPSLLPHMMTPVTSSKSEAVNKLKRPHSLPIQLRHIQKPSSRPQQTPEQSQMAGGTTVGVKGVTRTLSAPEGFGCSFPRSAGSGQDVSLPKTTTWVLPAASQSTSGVPLLTRKRPFNSHSLRTPQLDPNCEGNGMVAAGSPLINSSIQNGAHGTRGLGYHLSYGDNSQTPELATKARILAMDINANFTEPQELDTFIPEHHHFIPQETASDTGDAQGASPTSGPLRFGSLLQDRLHFRSNVGAESSSDWVPGPRSSWLDVSRKKKMPPRTLDFMQEEIGPLQEKDKEPQTCSRGCSTDSPPGVDPTSFLKMHLKFREVEELNTKELAKECRDVGVSTDELLSGGFQDSICPCARNCCHIADTGQSTITKRLGCQNSQSDAPDRSLPDPVDHTECQTILRSTEGGAFDALKETEPRQGSKGGRKVDKETSDKNTASVRESKSRRKTKPKERKDKDIAHRDDGKETSVQSWRVSGKGRRGSRTIVTCEESHQADAPTNRVVRIQNVGASTLPATADKKYIRHQPLKPIHQVDEEHRQRKVLQKLYDKANRLATPLPPTVTAWPASMHARAERVHSLPADLGQYRGSQSQTAASPASRPPAPAGRSSSGGEPIKSILSWDSGTVRRSSGDDLRPEDSGTGLKRRPLSLDVSSHYDVGADCLPPQEMHVSPREAEDEVDLVQKKALVTSIEGAVEHILSHFGKARTKSLEEKGRLGSTAHSPDIGHLMLHYLCPAVRALLQDGLRPHVTSFFVGRLKTTQWGVVEATTQLGPGTRTLHELVRQLSQLTHLKTSDLRVNAFLMGLLNIRCLELWLEHIRDHPDIVRSLYEPNAFLSLCNGATKAYFDRLLVAVQPLTLLPFDLDYKFEYQRLEHQLIQQRQLMDQHADKTGNAAPTQAYASAGGSWLRGTASLLRRNREGARKPEEPSRANETVTSSSLGFMRNLKGQRSVERTKNSRSSEQPVSGMWKTDENATPTRGVEQTRDLVTNKEADSNWSLDWIKGFVAASTEATTVAEGARNNQMTTSSGSTWSRFGSSLSKVFERIRPENTASTTQQPSTHRDRAPNRTPEKGTTISAQAKSPQNVVPPTSPVTPGSPVKARCHHVTMSQEELSFSKGSILTVKQQVDPDWLMCSQGDQSGLVHIDYVQGME